jgi:hypothetical protein
VLAEKQNAHKSDEGAKQDEPQEHVSHQRPICHGLKLGSTIKEPPLHVRGIF